LARKFERFKARIARPQVDCGTHVAETWGMAIYQNPGPTREEIDAEPGRVLLEFGTDWCGHCQTAAPAVRKALANHPDVLHIAVEDGPGRRLGRSFRVKLWPTLVFLKDGVEISRLVRPTETESIRAALERMT
jgi:thioredoxin 1